MFSLKEDTGWVCVWSKDSGAPETAQGDTVAGGTQRRGTGPLNLGHGEGLKEEMACQFLKVACPTEQDNRFGARFKEVDV